MNVEGVQDLARRLLQENCAAEDRLSALGELRDSIEIVQSQDYGRYLTVIVPAFLSLLSQDKYSAPVFNSGDPLQRIRLTTLEILHRFPQTEALKSFAPDIMAILMDILRLDNEENAAVALKVIVDLHKNFKSLVEEFVQPFFDFVKEAYKNMERAVDEAFSKDQEVGSALTLCGCVLDEN
jgi:transformation/transcription domain-associated protein